MNGGRLGLPYGPDFHFVDEIVEHAADRIVTRTDWGARPAILAAHFLDGPAVVPGSLLLEAAAQSGLLLYRGSRPEGGLAHIGRANCSFLHPVTAPCRTETRVTLALEARHNFALRAEIVVHEAMVATILFACSDRLAIPSDV